LRLVTKKSLCASTAALALVLASAMLAPAFAADLSIAPIYKAPPAAASWAGSYVGIAGGGAWGSALLRNDTTGADQAPRRNSSGGIIGLTSGFNLQNGNWLLGFEGDISAANKKANAFEFPPNAAFSNEVKEQWLSTFRGRVGYTRDNWLVYATAGGALANVANSILLPSAPSRTSSGIGAGPRAAASRSSSVRTGRRKLNISTWDRRTNPISPRRRARHFRAISVCTSTTTSFASG